MYVYHVALYSLMNLEYVEEVLAARNMNPTYLALKPNKDLCCIYLSIQKFLVYLLNERTKMAHICSPVDNLTV